MTDVIEGPVTSTGGERPSGNIFSRLGVFLRQVGVELRRVIWPTRRQVVNYSIVLLVFVVIMGLYIAGLDFIFTEGVLFVFGR
jgi:preprotein translocase subunit SecE